MTDQEIPHSDNVVLYAKPSLVDAQLGQVDGSVFVWNGRGSGLSANWLEYFGYLSKEEQIGKVRELIHLQMGPNGKLAELNVGTVLGHISEELDEPRFLHKPSPPNPPKYPQEDPTHCELVGMPIPEDPVLADKIGDMIALCVTALHKTKEDDST